MEDQAPFQDYPAYVERPKRKGRAGRIFLILFIIIIVLVAGLYFLGNNRNSVSGLLNSPTPTPEALPTEEPTPTPTPELDRKELSLRVLNGSGVAGAANSTAQTLRDLGYNVTGTGNADNFNYTGITIMVSEDDKDYLDLLKKDLEEKASASAVTASVSADLTTGGEVIVGK